ncbi:MAG TPA: GDYXXLXY domain-containing protein, partial [Candidatus Manganitrophaceae bacterium]|nr:GDYXXLXY domain-containing protein [Candidatus Manganitrophaceae bacterium]
KKHDRIYVLLKNGDPYWTPVSIHHEPPVTASGEVAIRGEVTGVIEKSWNPGTRQYEEGKRLQIRYGIENYFVPEGEGRALERPGPDQNISIRVAVDRFGGAGIKAVLVNGLPRYTERLF